VLEKEYDLSPNATIELVFPWADQIVYHGFETTQQSIVIRYRTEGEYQNQTHLSEKKSGATLRIEEQFFFLNEAPNDKLSAHKNIVSNVQVYAPSDARVSLEVKEAMVHIKGTLSAVELFLENGHCLWEAQLDKGQIETLGASVEIQKQNLGVLGVSQNGKVHTLPLQGKNPHLIVRSINGDILQR